MAFMKSADGKNAILDCECGCDEGFRIKIVKNDDDSYVFASFTNGNFYRDQNMSCFSVLARKLKKIWRIIRNKDYYYSDIQMSKKDFEEFKEFICGVE